MANMQSNEIKLFGRGNSREQWRTLAGKGVERMASDKNWCGGTDGYAGKLSAGAAYRRMFVLSGLTVLSVLFPRLIFFWERFKSLALNKACQSSIGLLYWQKKTKKNNAELTEKSL